MATIKYTSGQCWAEISKWAKRMPHINDYCKGAQEFKELAKERKILSSWEFGKIIRDLLSEERTRYVLSYIDRGRMRDTQEELMKIYINGGFIIIKYGAFRFREIESIFFDMQRGEYVIKTSNTEYRVTRNDECALRVQILMNNMQGYLFE